MATLSAAPRSTQGKNAARQLRRQGRVPAVIYGHGERSESLSVDRLALEKLLARISVENTLISLEVEGREAQRTLIREVQWHPYKNSILHIDFFHVHAGEKLRVDVPVRLVGTPVGVREGGGVMDQVLYDLHVECLPRDIPEVAEVDVSGLEVGESLRVSEVTIPNATILNDADLPVASVVAPTKASLPETPETEPGVGGMVEPELIRDRAADAEDVPTTAQG